MDRRKPAPRRNQLDKNTPAELAIYHAMQEVEKAGADVRLTKAQILLAQARDLVADVVDHTKCTCPDDQCLLGKHPDCRWVGFYETN